MRGQPEFFDIDDRLKRLSDLGDQLETSRSAVDFELFRPELNAALSYTDRTEGGRPPFDPVLMFKILVNQATKNLSDDRAEFLINDRLSHHVSIDRRFGFIRRWVATDAAAYEGRRLRQRLLESRKRPSRLLRRPKAVSCSLRRIEDETLFRKSALANTGFCCRRFYNERNCAAGVKLLCRVN
jgi:hypothetical protein